MLDENLEPILTARDFIASVQHLGAAKAAVEVGEGIVTEANKCSQ